MQRVRDFLRTSVDIDTSLLKTPASAAVVARGALARWIHQEGGADSLRPLNGDERDRALGFPAGASKADANANDEWQRARAIGNAFSPSVVRRLLGPLFDSVAGGGAPVVRCSHLGRLSQSAALRQLGATPPTGHARR